MARPDGWTVKPIMPTSTQGDNDMKEKMQRYEVRERTCCFVVVEVIYGNFGILQAREIDAYATAELAAKIAKILNKLRRKNGV